MTPRLRTTAAAGLLLAFVGLATLCSQDGPGAPSRSFAPGGRVLLDAHNCYPEAGQWADRMERALATGLPVAIEQDVAWSPGTDGRPGRSVVSHETSLTGTEPGLREHFFERVRPIMERALRDGNAGDWPLVTLNLEFKTNEREHHAAVRALLDEYDSWLTTAERGRSPRTISPLRVGPLLVLTGDSAEQEVAFHDAVAVGGRIKVFGAIALDADERAARLAPGATRDEQRLAFWRALPDMTFPPATNYRRWWNNAWSAVEAGGARQARDWTASDLERLRGLVRKAHDAGLWIRFYTLNGHPDGEGRGWSPSYNFGSAEAVEARWRAAIDAGVDFIATDQYEELAAVLRDRRSTTPRN